MTEIRTKAADSLGVHVADMPAAAQSTRVYDEYLAEVGKTATEALTYLAVSLVGPRNRVDKLVRHLSLVQ